MKKLISAVLLAAVLFVFLNSIFSNMIPDVLNYSMAFRFRIPGLFTLRSSEMPLGFILISTFSAGIIFLAFLQALPELFRIRERRAQDKKIRELEDELKRLKDEKAIPSFSQKTSSEDL